MAEVLLALAAEEQREQAAPDELVPVRGCGLPERTVRRLLRGKLVKLGRAHYVRRSDLLALQGDAPRPAPTEDNASARAVARAWRASKRRAAA